MCMDAGCMLSVLFATGVYLLHWRMWGLLEHAAVQQLVSDRLLLLHALLNFGLLSNAPDANRYLS